MYDINDRYFIWKRQFKIKNSFRIAKMLSRGQNQELDTLEDIFRQKEGDLESGILNFTLRDKGNKSLFPFCLHHYVLNASCLVHIANFKM